MSCVCVKITKECSANEDVSSPANHMGYMHEYIYIYNIPKKQHSVAFDFPKVHFYILEVILS